MDQDSLNSLAAYLSEQIEADDENDNVITDLEFTVEELSWILNKVYDDIQDDEDFIED